jgi:hypothetical protein
MNLGGLVTGEPAANWSRGFVLDVTAEEDTGAIPR